MEKSSLESLDRRFMAFCKAYLREYRARHPGWGLRRTIPDAEDVRNMEEIVRETGMDWLRKKE